MSVILQPLPNLATSTVVVGTAVRKNPTILVAYLQTLAWQEWPDRVKPVYCFVADTADPAALSLLRGFVAEHGGVVLEPGAGPSDTDDAHPVTHQWSPAGMARVGQLKNRILRYTQEIGASHCWLVDADLLLDKTTFKSLWTSKAPIACAVYWTHWHNPGVTAGKIHAAPQVWLSHPYNLEGRGYDAAEFRRTLLDRQRIQVWGQGACTLIERAAIDKGVSFDYIPGVPTEGMMAGEDRHFCLRAEGLHLPMVADPWPDIFHVYHPQDQEHIPAMLAQLGQDHPTTAEGGDLVSALLEPLEPVLVTGGAVSMPPVWFRGRLGGAPMLPELEERLGSMARGSTAVFGVHFPIHHPVTWLRGQRRLLRVTLLDCKPYGFPPVVDRELLVGTATGAMADRVTLTQPQQDALKADQAVTV